jgi:hypothetical protein
VLATEYAPITRDAMKRLQDAYEEILATRQRSASIVDPVSRWERGEELLLSSDLVVYAGFHYQYRYTWDDRRRAWFPIKPLRRPVEIIDPDMEIS